MAPTISFLLQIARKDDFLVEHRLRGLSSVSCPRTAAMSVTGSEMLTSQETGQYLVNVLTGLMVCHCDRTRLAGQDWLLRLPETVHRRVGGLKEAGLAKGDHISHHTPPHRPQL